MNAKMGDISDIIIAIITISSLISIVCAAYGGFLKKWKE